MDNLQILHDLERHIGYMISTEDGDAVLSYLNDDPCSTDPQYLSELFAPLQPAIYS